MESSIFVLDPIKGEFWHFKVERRVLTSGTVDGFDGVTVFGVDGRDFRAGLAPDEVQ